MQHTIRIATVAPDAFVNEPDFVISSPDLDYAVDTAKWGLAHWFTTDLPEYQWLNLVETGSLTHMAGLHLEYEVTA